jgi:hypothetical protein
VRWRRRAFDRTDAPVSIELAPTSLGIAKTIHYWPVSGTRPGQAFKRRAGISDEACKKLAPRH